MTQITITSNINTSTEKVWDCLTNPIHIVNWNFASDDWCCPSAYTDLKEGGVYKSRMEAKDGSVGFDFVCTINSIIPNKSLNLTMEDGRKWNIEFESFENYTKVTEVFDSENENSEEMQRTGWQAILNNFKKYTESLD